MKAATIWKAVLLQIAGTSCDWVRFIDPSTGHEYRATLFFHKCVQNYVLYSRYISEVGIGSAFQFLFSNTNKIFGSTIILQPTQYKYKYINILCMHATAEMTHSKENFVFKVVRAESWRDLAEQLLNLTMHISSYNTAFLVLTRIKGIDVRCWPWLTRESFAEILSSFVFTLYCGS